MLNEDCDIDKIEDLCKLLRKEDGPSLEWMKAMDKAMTDVDPYTVHGFLDEKERTSRLTPLLPELFSRLQECLLNLRWPEALDLLQKLSHKPTTAGNTTWKVGAELLTLESDSNRDLLHQLFQQFRSLADMNCNEVLIQFVVYLLSIGEREEAMSTMQDVKHRHGSRRAKEAEQTFMQRLQTAYLGLMWYMEWKVAQKNLNQLQQSQEKGHDVMTDSKIVTFEKQMQNSSNKALKLFSKLEGLAGVWDIFVTKHAELLVARGEFPGAESLLQQYCDTNPTNLNAYKYMYTYLQQNDPSSTNINIQLKKIAELSPSDRLVLDLINSLWQDKDCAVIDYLFKLLDYAAWQMNVDAWQRMADCLKYIAGVRLEDSYEYRKAIEACWTVRQSWWPPYHFNKHVVKLGKKTTQLNFYKILVAALLCGKESGTVSKCSKYLSEEEKLQVYSISSSFNQPIT